MKHGGFRLFLYENSLLIAFFTLFFASIVLHAISGVAEYNAEGKAHGDPPISTAQFATTAAFWFQSFQNWQSEFLAVGAIVLLTIVLRQRGSSESKPVAPPHTETGSSIGSHRGGSDRVDRFVAHRRRVRASRPVPETGTR